MLLWPFPDPIPFLSSLLEATSLLSSRFFSFLLYFIPVLYILILNQYMDSF